MKTKFFGCNKNFSLKMSFSCCVQTLKCARSACSVLASRTNPFVLMKRNFRCRSSNIMGGTMAYARIFLSSALNNIQSWRNHNLFKCSDVEMFTHLQLGEILHDLFDVSLASRRTCRSTARHNPTATKSHWLKPSSL